MLPNKAMPARLVAALCGLVFSSAPLFAQTSPYSPDDEVEDTYVLPTFSVESETVDRYRAADAVSAVRVRTSLIETPSTISVLTKDFIEDVSPLRVRDIAQYTASVQSLAGSGTAETMLMRGFQSAWKTIDNYLDYSGYLMEPALIERIEISKGPNAILAPGVTPGGHVNIVTKAPQFERSTSITAIFGGWDTDKFSIDTTGPLDDSGRFAYRLVGAYQDTRRYWAKDAERTRKAIAPSFTWRISPSTELTLRYNYHNTAEARDPFRILDSSVTQRGQKPVLAPGFSYGRSRNGVPNWSVSSYDGGTASAQFKTSFNKHITMRLAAFAHRAGSISETASLSLPGLSSRYNPYDGILTPNQTWALQDDSLPYDEVSNRYVATDSPYFDPNAIPLRGNQGTHWRKTGVVQNDWVFSFELPYTKLQTVTGWAYTDDSYMFRTIRGDMAPYNIFDLDNQDQSVNWTGVYTDNHTDWEDSTQVFINQRASFWGDRIAVSGGYLWFERENKVQDDLRNEYRRVKGDKGMYMGSVLYRFTPQASVYYSHSTNAVPGGSSNGVRLWREGKQNEVGIKTEFFNRRLSLNVAYFEISEDNVAVPNPDYDGTDLSIPAQIITSQDNHGFEIELNGALTRNLSAVGSFSQVKMSDFYGRDVIFVSKNLAALHLSYRIKEGAFSGFSATLGAVYTGEFVGDTPVELTPLRVPGQPSFYVPSNTLVNAGLGYDLGRYQVRLYVDNLLDKKNYIRYGGGRSGVTAGEPLLVKLSATLKF